MELLNVTVGIKSLDRYFYYESHPKLSEQRYSKVTSGDGDAM